MTRIGVGSYALAWAIGVAGYPPKEPMDLATFLRRCATAGVSLVQIADNLPLEAMSDDEIDAAVALARDLGLTVELGLRGLEPHRVARYLALCERFGATMLRAVVDGPGFEPDDDQVVSMLRELVPTLEASGVTLAIENHDRFTADRLARIIESADSPRVAVCLDTVNSFGALEGPVVVVQRLAPHVVNLHVKDFVIGRPEHNMGFVLQGVPAGQGRLDMHWLLDALAEAGRSPDVILELWPPQQETLEDTIALERAWLNQSLAYLRPLIESREKS